MGVQKQSVHELWKYFKFKSVIEGTCVDIDSLHLAHARHSIMLRTGASHECKDV